MKRKSISSEVGRLPQSCPIIWPWGWVIDSDHFIELLRRVFDKHQGHVWMFNSDLAIHRDCRHFEALYDGYIRGNPKVDSVRFVLSSRRLKQFKSEPVYKRRFKDLPDEDIGKFLFRTLEEVQETYSQSPVFAEFLRTFSPFDDDGNENVIVFYTVSDNILNGDTVTIFRPTIYPFVAMDEHGEYRRRALAGQSANWKVIAQLCADALQDVFRADSKFSRLGVKRHPNGDIQEFTFNPDLISPIEPPLTMSTEEEEVNALGKFLQNLEHIDLTNYRIVGNYVRYDESVRNDLTALLDEIGVVLSNSDRWKKRNNFLLWAAPGMGKTEFVNKVGDYFMGPFASTHGLTIEYRHRKLSDLNEAQLQNFVTEVQKLLTNPSTRVLAFLDEIDKKPNEDWPLSKMLGPLEWNFKEGKSIVWLFAGSSKNNVKQFEKALQKQISGPDFLRRTQRPPTEISALTIFDRVLIACSHIIQQFPNISFFERSALLFLAGASSDAGEVIARASVTLRKLKMEPTRKVVYLSHCIEYGPSEAVDDFKSKFADVLKKFGSGNVRVTSR